jgi:anthranilate synthase component 2
MVLVVDFYDSFTYNLVHYFENAGEHVEIVFHDQLILERLEKYSLVVLSPGPGLPNEKENLFDCITICIENSIPIFGVCLGFQALGISLGAQLVNQHVVKHGVSTELTWVSPKSKLFQGIKNTISVGLYHSWKLEDIPTEYLTSYSAEGVAMSLECYEKRIMGVQFHPESILTQHGRQLIENVVAWKNLI